MQSIERPGLTNARPRRAASLRAAFIPLFLLLACFAVAQAATGRVARHYDVEVPDREDDTTLARVWRDGQLALEWTVEGRRGRVAATVTELPFLDLSRKRS